MSPTASCTIMMVDEEDANLELLEAFLRPEGYERFIRVLDAREAGRVYEECRPDLVLLDLHMPHRSGFEVLNDLRERTPRDEYVPVLMLTADDTAEAKERALAGGARDFLTKPLDAVEVVLRVRNLLEARWLHLAQRQARAAAEAAHARAQLLADASRVLGAALDSSTSLDQLGRLLVPRFADQCVILVNDPAGPTIALAADVDPDRETDVRSRWSDAGSPSLADLPAEADTDVIAAPLTSLGRGCGILRLARRAPRPPFDEPERELVEELAGRAAAALEKTGLIAAAQRAAHARDHVLSVIAHDLRNPLTAIAANAEMLRAQIAPRAPALQRRTLERIEQIAQRTHEMLDDLLEIARAQSQAFALRRTAVDVADLVSEADAMLQPLARARNVNLRFAGEAGVRVDVDRGRVLQVLSNLVGNAIKFTPDAGHVAVDWRANGTEATITVRDDGPGIPLDQVPHIFRPFWQADPSDRRGVGLGLMIARTLVEAHGGRIWVEEPGETGAAFCFTLPFATGERGPEETDGP